MTGKKSGRAMAATVISRLRKLYPEATTALTHDNPLELLVATILSAQCTDERVNKVTEILFRKYRTANDYATVRQEVFENEIRSTGFFRAKAKNIIACCQILVAQHGGEVPSSMEELVRLPGVGRKTANVVLGSAFGKSEGIVVDTHVRRLTYLLGLTKSTDPVTIEQDLMQIVPRSAWIDLPHLLIWHGRKICRARKPLCGECVLSDVCPSAEVPHPPQRGRRVSSRG